MPPLHEPNVCASEWDGAMLFSRVNQQWDINESINNIGRLPRTQRTHKETSSMEVEKTEKQNPAK